MGNPFVHLDLATTDLEAAKQFYAQVFDWKFEEMPQMGYIGINVGEGVGGGMGKTQSPEQPPSWTAYVDVADVRATMRKAEAAGARVLVDYMPVGDMGWLGVFQDPQGATIGIWQTARREPPPKPETARGNGRGNGSAAGPGGASKQGRPAATKGAAPKKGAVPKKTGGAPAKGAAGGVNRDKDKGRQPAAAGKSGKPGANGGKTGAGKAASKASKPRRR